MATNVPAASAMSHVQSHLSRGDQIAMVILLLFVAFTIILPTFLLDVVRKRDPIRPTVQQALIRAMGGATPYIPLKYIRVFQKPTGVVIAALCAKNNISHDFVELDTGNFSPGSLHFVDTDSKHTGNIMLYFHGGGYIFAMPDGHFDFARLAAKTSNSALAILEYTLAPHGPYPTQLAQAAAAVQYLLKFHDPSQILIGGDSAGGNLTLALLAHLRSPCPRVQPLSPGLELRGALAISPRTSRATSSNSFKTNASKDLISAAATERFNREWKPKDEVWAAALFGSKEFWSVVSAKRVLLTVGGDEVYRDDILSLAKLMGAEDRVGASRQCTLCPGEIHVQCVFDHGMGVEGKMLVTVLEWLRSLP